MSDRLRYEQELAKQLQDLPLPDEDMAWADMKRRLEDDDDDAVMIPPFTWGCGGWALLLAVLLGLAWWIVRPEKWITGNTKKIENPADTARTGGPQAGTRNAKTSTDSNTVHLHAQHDTFASGSSNISDKKPEIEKSTEAKTRSIEQAEQVPFSKTKSSVAKENVPGKKRLKEPRRNNTDHVNKPVRKKKMEGAPVAPGKNETISPQKDPLSNSPAPNESPDENKVVSTDTLQQPKTNAELVNQPKDTLSKKEESKKRAATPKRYSFGTGLSLFQQIPVGGQSAVPYSSQGRKFSLTDYIPSVYARLYRENKWFVQAEFRYGAPQYTRQLTYGQIVVPDSTGSRSTITSQKLKKTFYHQLPVSFHYYILPDWSLGAGVVWNKFHSAVYEQDITARNNITQQDSFISKSIRQTRRDSSFAKSYWQALFETQYKWKRFSLGARYSFGLQPYIRFGLPGSPLQEEKNSSLQVFLRYELWRSKKK